MGQRVALLHTSFVLFEGDRFLLRMFEEQLPDVEFLNIVEDKMIQEVMRVGYVTPELTRRMCFYVLAAEAMRVDAIFNTCTSLGPAVEVAKKLTTVPVVKIDDGLTEQAARQGQKIGVLATVPTALRPTVDLIREKARAIGKEVQIQEGLSSGAFELLRKGEVARHDDMIVQTARDMVGWADTFVLAQVSMARLEPRLSAETGRPVLASPNLAVEQLKQVLQRLL
jgi:Asp/Glu/hydantoin racemase